MDFAAGLNIGTCKRSNMSREPHKVESNAKCTGKYGLPCKMHSSQLLPRFIIAQTMTTVVFASGSEGNRLHEKEMELLSHIITSTGAWGLPGSGTCSSSPLWTLELENGA